MAFNYEYQNAIQISGVIRDNRTYAEKMTIRLSTGRERYAGAPRSKAPEKAAAVQAGKETTRDMFQGNEPTFDIRNADLYKFAVIDNFVTVTGHFSKETTTEHGRQNTHDVFVADKIEETGTLISRVFGGSVKSMDNVRTDDKNMFVLKGELVSVVSRVGGNGKAYKQVQVRVPWHGEEAARAERRAKSKGVAVQYPVFSVKAFGSVADGLAKYRRGDNIAILGTIGTKTFLDAFGERRRITSPIATSTGLIARPEPEQKPKAKTQPADAVDANPATPAVPDAP